MARFCSFAPWSLSFLGGGAGGGWEREIIVQFYILSKIVTTEFPDDNNNRGAQWFLADRVPLKRRDKGQAEVKHIKTREK